MNTFSYSIPTDRELNETERAILRKLIVDTHPDRENEIDSLHVRGRCGCGSCPTVMFERDPTKEKSVLAEFQGGDAESGLAGITLWESNGRISELEAWPIDGADIRAWPAFETIKPLEVSRL